jgi:enoyl-CoA hydratase
MKVPPALEVSEPPMSLVRIEKPSPGTSVIILDRPERLNSMAFELMTPLHAS